MEESIADDLGDMRGTGPAFNRGVLRQFCTIWIGIVLKAFRCVVRRGGGVLSKALCEHLTFCVFH